MQHFTRRCKHCGKSYVYCTYGNGPEYGTQKGCSMEYCAECQKAINDALAKIPTRIIKDYSFVKGEKEIERISKIFEEEKEKYYSTPKFLNVHKMIPAWNFKSVELCYIDKTEYYKCIAYDGTILYKVAVEYDVIEGKLTGETYFEVDAHDGYVSVSQFKLPQLSSSELIVRPMSPPKGDLFYIEAKWNNNSSKDDKRSIRKSIKRK